MTYTAPVAPVATEATPIILLVEIIGETGVGKTYIASTAPKPFLIDTSVKGEACTTFKRVGREMFNTDYSDRYVHVQNWVDIQSAIKKSCERFDVSSVIIDNSSDLQDMAKDKYLSSFDKKRVQAIQVEYGKIRDLVDVDTTFKVAAMPPNGAGKNLILTSQMKDKWKQVQTSSNDVKAIQDGRMRDGYARLDFQSDIRLHVVIQDSCSKCGKIIPTGEICNTESCLKTFPMPSKKLKRFVSVVKNRFLNRVGESWIPELKTNDWSGIKELVKLAPGEKLLE